MDEARLLLSEALRVSPQRINEGTKMYDLPAWDSMGHMSLIALVEERLRISISMDDILEIRSVQGIATILKKYRSKT